MVHADAASIPQDVTTKDAFYDHLQSQIEALVDQDSNWVSALSNASSLIYHSLNRFKSWSDKKVNWAGFYLLSPLFPGGSNAQARSKPTLLLGPFVGLPACQLILSVPGKGVCADASSLLPPRPVRVSNTDEYPGHIACDSLSRSELVCPLVIPRSRLSSRHLADLEAQSPSARTSVSDSPIDKSWAGRGSGEKVIVGVLDIDCEALDGFDETDASRLQAIADLLASRVMWS